MRTRTRIHCASTCVCSCRALLLKEALEEVNKTKRQRYESWRRQALNAAGSGRRLRHVLLWTIMCVATRAGM